ncbi:MAG: serine hydrolase [Candidatus Kapabacteria bacterium]|nr:serine hydrolase [Candidatus Kapabacteria bacterium]
MPIKQIRLQDTGLTKPLLLVETQFSNPSLEAIESSLYQYINQLKVTGQLSSISVYLKELNTPYCIEINPTEFYDPASLTKVPLMLYVLSLDELRPGYLDKKILISKNSDYIYTPTISSKTLEEGKKYTYKELLYYMIAYSDNESFIQFVNNISMNDFIHFLSYFEIPMITDDGQRQNHQKNFIANINSLSRFFRVLYNSTFLNRANSQYALNLLTECEFKKGILQGLPANIKVAHKYGERFENGVAQFHEFGIVYYENSPYLLGVMTKGTNLEQLKDVIANVSKIVYEGMQVKNTMSSIK